MDQGLRFTVVIRWSDEDQAFVASVPQLPGCAADGQTYVEAATNIHEVMEEWIATARSLGRPIPPADAPDPRYPLRGTVIKYIDPLAPVAEEDWEVLQAGEPRDRHAS